ncbi:MAG: AAA family ATPase [Gammaproteobacteria bacterium]|nr:AAA family ATPase [Gammaproteobacteria bacterium]
MSSIERMMRKIRQEQDIAAVPFKSEALTERESFEDLEADGHDTIEETEAVVQADDVGRTVLQEVVEEQVFESESGINEALVGDADQTAFYETTDEQKLNEGNETKNITDELVENKFLESESGVNKIVIGEVEQTVLHETDADRTSAKEVITDGSVGFDQDDAKPTDKDDFDSEIVVAEEFSSTDAAKTDELEPVAKAQSSSTPNSATIGMFDSFLKTHKAQLAEEYRRIKLPLLKNAFDEGLPPISGHRNMVMITSSIPGEGKTFNALHLAISISMEKEKTVLLLDADLQMARLSRSLGFSNNPGLSDYLYDRGTDLADYICKTPIPNFSFIPAGLKKQQTAELLSSRLMKMLTDELALRYDDRFVMLDSAPVLASSEARILAGLVGQVALVVEAEATPRTTVEEAVKHLEGNDVVGLIFNKCPKRSGAGYYDAYYGGK